MNSSNIDIAAGAIAGGIIWVPATLAFLALRFKTGDHARGWWRETLDRARQKKTDRPVEPARGVATAPEPPASEPDTQHMPAVTQAATTPARPSPRVGPRRHHSFDDKHPTGRPAWVDNPTEYPVIPQRIR